MSHASQEFPAQFLGGVLGGFLGFVLGGFLSCIYYDVVPLILQKRHEARVRARVQSVLALHMQDDGSHGSHKIMMPSDTRVC